MVLHAFKTSLTLIVMGLLLTVTVIPAFAQGSPDQITIRVDGLSCPFCAYGLEKKLKLLEGTAKLTIDMERGVVEITTEGGKVIPEEDLRKAVADAGFTPRKITYRSAQPQ